MDNGYTELRHVLNGNAMTELTNGKLDVWTLQSLDEDYVPNWLQRKDHLTTDPQHPFLLIDTETRSMHLILAAAGQNADDFRTSRCTATSPV